MKLNTDIFSNATFRLTGWYLAILMVLSLLFSVIVYNIASHEVERAAGPRRGGEMQLYIEDDIAEQIRRGRIEESNRNLVANLIFFNVTTIAAGGLVSYLLARRTLHPIKVAMESQARFSSDAAHELRTPLAVMQSEIEVNLRDKKANKQSFQQVLESNLDEVHRLRTLTDRLLLLAGRQPLELQSVQIEDVAVDAMNRSIPLAQAKKIAIENSVGAATVMAHAESLTDVLCILIDNAIKYSDTKRTVWLRSRVSEKFVTIEVADEGIGIAGSDAEKIFDRFYRVDLSRSKQNIDGHGLGLSIAKQLVELQGGTIDVKSQVGQGSTFTIRLPRRA